MSEEVGRPTGRELRLLNSAIDAVNLLETGMGITLSPSATQKVWELRQACEQYRDAHQPPAADRREE